MDIWTTDTEAKLLVSILVERRSAQFFGNKKVVIAEHKQTTVGQLPYVVKEPEVLVTCGPQLVITIQAMSGMFK